MKKVRIRKSDIARIQRDIGVVTKRYLTGIIARAKRMTIEQKGLGEPVPKVEAIEFPTRAEVIKRWKAAQGKLKLRNPKMWTPAIIPDFLYYGERLIDREEEAKFIDLLFGLKRNAYLTAALKVAQDMGSVPIVNEAAIEALRAKTVKIVTTDITPTLRDELIARMERDISSGFTIDETAHSLGLLNTNWRTIAKTETHDAFEIGAREQIVKEAEEYGADVYKYWQHSGNVNGRPEHIKAGEVYDEAHAIPLNDPFIVGGESLQYPHDPSGSAEQVVNCGCTAVYIVK